MKEKGEYIKPLIDVVYIGDLLQTNLPASPHMGYGGGGAKGFDDEWQDDEENSITNKWDNLVPSGVPESWQPVGE